MKRVNSLIEEAAEKYASNLKLFNPALNGNYITEENLNTHLSSAFIMKNTNGVVFGEVSLSEGLIDRYMFCDDYAILLESKNITKDGSVRSIEGDMLRMDIVVDELYSRHAKGNKPKRIFGVILAQFYGRVASKHELMWDKTDNRNTFWKGSDKTYRNWWRDIAVEPLTSSGCLYDKIKINHTNFLENIYWVYAIKILK